MILRKKKSLNAGPINGTGEGVAHSKRWYVALVRMHHEKKVSEHLDKMGIENFVPVQQEFHQWSDRRKLVTSVLLPMMVFVHVDPKERMEVLSFSTVSRYMVMRGESSPAVIPDEQMARFRFMLDYSEESISMNSSPLARGEKVRVIKGPLTGLVGELVNVDGKSKIAVRLNMLGCACVDMGGVQAACIWMIFQHYNDPSTKRLTIYILNGGRHRSRMLPCVWPSFRDIMCRCTPIRKTKKENRLF